MTTSTFASMFVESCDQQEAQADLGEGFFTAPLSVTGKAPATHYWASGFFLDDELDLIVNEVIWPCTVKFGDATEALRKLGLQPVIEPPMETPTELNE